MIKIPLTIVYRGPWKLKALHVIALPTVNGTSFKDLDEIPLYFNPRTNDWTRERDPKVFRVVSVAKGHIEVLYAEESLDLSP